MTVQALLRQQANRSRMRERQQARESRVHDRVERTRKPPPQTRADIEQIVASSAKMDPPHVYVQIRVPRSSRPAKGMIRLFGRSGPLSVPERGVDWEPCGACSAWWYVEDLAALLVPREPTRAELDQLLEDLREAVASEITTGLTACGPGSSHYLAAGEEMWAKGRDASDVAALAKGLVVDLDRKLSAWPGDR